MVRSVCFSYVMAVAAVVAGCSAPVDSTGGTSPSNLNAQAGQPVSIGYAEGGKTTAVSSTDSELADVAGANLDGVSHHGQPVVDASAALALDELELTRNNGRTVTIVREGTTFRQKGSEGGLAASWDGDFRSVRYSNLGGETTSVDLSAVNDSSVRAKLAGRFVFEGLRAPANSDGVVELGPVVIVPLIGLAGTVVTVAACLFGQHNCGGQAARGCGPGRVHSYAARCFKGPGCEYVCK